MIRPEDVPTSLVHWTGATLIVRSAYPPIDLFEDIAEPEDWPLLISAVQKTDPRLIESIGNLDLVPPGRRVGGPGASYLMAPFTHTSPDRPSRFSDGRLGVLYVAGNFETAVHETIHHHGRFMAATKQHPGWTSQFRELVMEVKGDLKDLREIKAATLLDPEDYGPAQAFGTAVRAGEGQGIVYPSVQGGGDCAGLFFPDLARSPMQRRCLDYHWNGETVDLVRDTSDRTVYRVS